MRKSRGQSPPAADKTLTKGLQVLESLCAGVGARGISELAKELSLTKSNVHRLLQTLRRCGFVIQEAESERYLLSSKLWRLARGGRGFEALSRIVRPVLAGLVAETGESAMFALVEGDNLAVVEQVETQNPVRVVFFSAGQSFPIERVVMPGKALTALQLIVLANRPDAEVRASLRNVQGELRERASFVDRQVATLAAIRRDGFAVSRGEWVSGVNALAVPVMDSSQRGTLLGVLSCFGPATRFDETSLQAFQKKLSLRARQLAELMAYGDDTAPGKSNSVW